MQSLARVTLLGSAPAELVRMLAMLGVKAFIADRREAAGMLVIFGAATIDDHAGVPVMRMALRTHEREYDADFIYDSPRAAACFILSRALGLTAPLLTADRQMFSVVRAAIAMARGPIKIVVEGETGTGKESLVHLIQAVSGNSHGMVQLDCAALEPDRADREMAAAIARASAPLDGDGGNPLAPETSTVFLHRVSELTLAGQARLLDLIRPGDGRGTLRYIATSSRSLALMGARGAFLPELLSFFTSTLRIPPLRARRGDIPMLARHFLRSLNPKLVLSASAVSLLSNYPFPGNLRELQNLVTRLAIAAPAGQVIGRMDVLSQLAPVDQMSLTRPSLWKMEREKPVSAIAVHALATFGNGPAGIARSPGGASGTPIPLGAAAAKPRKPRRNRSI